MESLVIRWLGPGVACAMVVFALSGTAHAQCMGGGRGMRMGYGGMSGGMMCPRMMQMQQAATMQQRFMVQQQAYAQAQMAELRAKRQQALERKQAAKAARIAARNARSQASTSTKLVESDRPVASP